MYIFRTKAELINIYGNIKKAIKEGWENIKGTNLFKKVVN